MSLVYSGGVHGGKFSVNRFVQLVSTAPAKLFGLYPRKGTVAVGSDADLIVFDADEEQTISVKTHHMRVDYSMFEGTRVKGVTKTVLSRGRVIVEDGKFVGEGRRGGIFEAGESGERFVRYAGAEIFHSGTRERR